LISQVAKLDGDKRLVMLLDPSHLLQGREIQAMNKAFDGGTPGDSKLARAA